MMHEIEEAFIRRFLPPRKRERALWELAHEKYRDDFLQWEMEHLLEESRCMTGLKHVSNAEDIAREMKRLGADEPCYCFGAWQDSDALLPLPEAARLVEARSGIIYAPKRGVAIMIGGEARWAQLICRPDEPQSWDLRRE